MEDKKQKLLDYMLKTGEIYSNKTIEAVSKPTGISSMIIKGVLQELVSEDLVDSDKIGASTYYWVFASKRSQAVMGEHARLTEKEADLGRAIKEHTAEIERAKEGREESADRSALLGRRDALHREQREQKAVFSMLLKNDPEKAEKMQGYTQIAVEQANVWTDNLYILQKFLRDKLLMEKSTCNKLLGITEDFDYL